MQSKMRECWNWQTGMTKDHVLVGRAGSSPAFRIELKTLESKPIQGFFFFVIFLSAFILLVRILKINNNQEKRMNKFQKEFCSPVYLFFLISETKFFPCTENRFSAFGVFIIGIFFIFCQLSFQCFLLLFLESEIFCI